MEKWVQKSVNEISSYVSRGKSPVYTDVSDFKVINQACVFPGRLKLQNLKFVTERFWKSLPEDKKILPGDVLVNSTGTGTLGRIGFVSDCNEANLTYDGHVTVVRVDDELYDWKFIYYVFQTEHFKNAIEAFCTTGSTNQIELVREAFLNLDIKLPADKAEQTRIAKILSTADEAIATTEALIEKYSRIKTGLMQDLLTRGIDEAGNIRSKASHRFAVKNGIEVPEEWEVEKLGDICSLIKDGTHLPPKRVHNGVWLLGVSNIVDSEWVLVKGDTKVSEAFFNEMHRTWNIQVGDVLLAIVGATIGKVTQVPRDFAKFTLQRSVCLLRGKDGKLFNSFLCIHMMSETFQNLLWSEVNVTAQPGIYLNSIANLNIPCPPFEEQKRIAEKIMDLNLYLKDYKISLIKLNVLKAGMMQDLLTGKVRVQTQILKQSHKPKS